MADIEASLAVRVAFASAPFSDSPSWTTITPDGMELHIRRGRSHLLDRVQCGTAALVLRNFSNQYYPDNAGGAYYPNVLPRKRINLQATYDGTPYDIYTGFIKTWTPSWLGQQGTLPIVTVNAADLFRNLSKLDLNDGTGYSSEASGARIDNILDDLGWPDDANHRDIDTGQTTLIATGALADENAMGHIHKVQESEFGVFFIAGDGVATWHDRHARLKSPFTTSQMTFGDDAGEKRYRLLEPKYDDDYLYNDVRITRSGGSQQAASDSTSIAAYGKSTFSRTGLLMATDSEALAQAQFLLSRYKDPALRAKRMIIYPQTDPTNLWPAVLGYDIGTRITVRLNQASIDEDYHIEGIMHDYEARRGLWVTTWELSNADAQSYWVLGTAGFSELGQTTRLAY